MGWRRRGVGVFAHPGSHPSATAPDTRTRAPRSSCGSHVGWAERGLEVLGFQEKHLRGDPPVQPLSALSTARRSSLERPHCP